MKKFDIVQDETKRNEWTVYLNGDDKEVATITIHDDSEIKNLTEMFNVCES